MNALPFLPLEIIVQILLCLPAEFLYDYGRFVCKAWARIICDPSFIEAHVLKSKDGLLFQRSSRPYHAHFLNLGNMNSYMTQLRFSFRGIPLASCRGICLYLGYGELAPPHEEGNEQYGCEAFYNCARVHVANPVTRQVQLLPSLGNLFYKSLHIAYIEQSREFKVVCFSKTSRDRWLVFTLGIDMSWRLLDAMMDTENIWGTRVGITSAAVGQFIYLSQSESTILAINLFDESVWSIQLPNTFHSYVLRKLGDNLSCVVYEREELHVWMLRDLESCEWVRVSDVEKVIARKKVEYYPFYPVGWLDNSHICVFELVRGWDQRISIMAFNAETGKADLFSYGNEAFCSSVIHTNSLVKW